MALGKIWHPEHFVCVHCRQELGTNIFFERDGHPYCENDYQILFSPKCSLCSGTILEVQSVIQPVIQPAIQPVSHSVSHSFSSHSVSYSVSHSASYSNNSCDALKAHYIF